jgi:Peptidase family M1 domain
LRRALTLALLALLVPGASAASAAPVEIRGADPVAHELDLRYLDRGAGVLEGSERIEFVNRGPAALDRVFLRLWANGPDRCRPRRIRVEIEAPASAGRESVRCTALEVRLEAPVAAGDTGEISLRFTVRVRRKADRFGRVGETALLGNVIPVLAVEDRRGLHLEPYSDIGESFYSLSARWDATLRLPARLRAATTGSVRAESVRGDTRTLRVGSAQARDFGLAVGRLGTIDGRQGGVNVRVFFAPAREKGARRGLRTARRAVREFGRRYGRYDSAELDVVLVANAFEEGGAGMEYPELVFSLPVGEIITHEVAHQWWYGMVGNNQHAEPWLDESFASYSHERLHPRVNFCRPRNPYSVVAPRWRHIALDSTMRLFERASPFVIAEVVYLAGSCALQRLERDIGEPRMTRLLRLLQTRFRHRVMTKSDVLGAVREVAPRYRLRRWLRIAHLSP